MSDDDREEPVVRFLREKRGKFREDEEGSAMLVSAPLLILLLLMLVAMILNIGFIAQKRNELQIVADCASRAGAQAVREDRMTSVKDAYGWHVYVELDPSAARNNIFSVIRAYQEANYRSTSGFTVNAVDTSPTMGHLYPEYNAAIGEYVYRSMTPSEIYYNGNCAVELSGTVETLLPWLLGLPERDPLRAYSATQAGGQTKRGGALLPGR